MIYGIAAAVLWGLGDLLAKGIVDRIGSRRAMAWVQGCSFLFAAAVIVVFRIDVDIPSGAQGGYLAITVLGNALSVTLLYRALARGPALLAVPLSTCSGAVALVISLAAGTTRLSLYSIILLVGVTGGAMAIATAPQNARRCWRDASLALASALAGGVATWSAGRWIGPVDTAAAGALLIMAVLTLTAMRPGRQMSRVLAPPSLAMLSAAAMCTVGGYAAFLGGVMQNRLDETAVLSTLSGAVAACGASVLLRERLSSFQYCGLALVAALVPLLSATT